MLSPILRRLPILLAIVMAFLAHTARGETTSQTQSGSASPYHDNWQPPKTTRFHTVATAQARPNRFADPWSLSLDATFWLHRRFAIEWQQSYLSRGWLGLEAGVCLPESCRRTWDNAGIAVRWMLADTRAFTLGAVTGYQLDRFFPLRPKILTGLWLRANRGRAWIALDTHLTIGIANRNRGNLDHLYTAIRARWQLSLPRRQRSTLFTVQLRSKIWGRIGLYSETAHIPIGIGIVYSIGSSLEATVEYTFSHAFGKQQDPYRRIAQFSVSWLIERSKQTPVPQ